MYNSNIEYEEFKDKHSEDESDLFMSVNEESEHNDPWMPNLNFNNSFDFGQPRPISNYYDTDPIRDTQNSLEDISEMLRSNCNRVLERDSKLKNIDEASEKLLTGAENFKKKSRNLKYKMLSQYVFHISAMILSILLIITLIVILVKT